MTQEQFKKEYPEAYEWNKRMNDPEFIRKTREQIRCLPKWKKQFLTNYNIDEK